MVNEFALFSIYKNLLSNTWFVVIYIPKTSRKLVAIINQSDILDTTENKLVVFQPIQYKDSIKINTNDVMSFIQFERICNQTKL